MPIILISVVVALVAGIGALVYSWKNPSAERPSSDGTPLLGLGMVFMVAGVAFVITGRDVGYSWAPIGIVFLGVGARQRRQRKAQS